MSSLLPTNSTPLELAVERGCLASYGQPVPIPAVWEPEICPAALLPRLAQIYAVDEWDDTWPSFQKISAIETSVQVHQQKGTLASICLVLENNGFVVDRIIENANRSTLDGTRQLNGWYMYGSSLGAMMYRVILKTRNVTALQIESLVRQLESTAPARCLLIGIHYASIPVQYNGTARCDGTYNDGNPIL